MDPTTDTATDTNTGSTTDLKSAMQKIRADRGLGKQFIDDPAGTVTSLGVDVSQHRIHKTEPVPTGATHGACVSGGCGVCASAG